MDRLALCALTSGSPIVRNRLKQRSPVTQIIDISSLLHKHEAEGDWISQLVMSEANPNPPSGPVVVESSLLPPKAIPRRKRSREFPAIIFVGPCGIRAGWPLIIFLAINIALIAGAILMARASRHTASALENEVVPFLIVLVSSWVMARIEHRRIADYGLPWRRAFQSQFWQGIAMGFSAITVLLGSMRLAGVFRFGTIGLHGFDIWRDGVMWSMVFFCGTVRGILLSGLCTFHTDHGNEILAVSHSPFRLLRLASSRQSQRELGGRYRGGRHGPAFLPDAAPNWRPLDAHRVPRGVGLGRNVFPWRA